jgi:hypothetical protein
MRTAIRTRGLLVLRLLSVVGVIAACGAAVRTTGGSDSPSTRPSATSTGPFAQSPRPCSLLTQTTAAQISGDTRVTNQATDLLETESRYVACIFADTRDEADRVEVQIKRVPGGVDPATLRDAATFFSLGEPVQPFQAFPVVGIGDHALGETTPGVAFIVFARGDLLVYVGAGSASVGAAALRSGVEDLAKKIAAAL